MQRAGRLAASAMLMLIVLGLTFSAGFGASQVLSGSATPTLQVLQQALSQKTVKAEPQQFQLLGEIWQILKQDYVEEASVDSDKLGRGAINGMIATLNDRHTTFIDADLYKQERTQLEQRYEGIGAHVTENAGAIIIVAPIVGSPAERSGMKPGDRILEVDGKAISGMALADVVAKIKGPRGTVVRLLVLHVGESAPIALELTRAEIQTGSVYPRMLAGEIMYIRITQFGQRTGDELKTVLRDAKQKGAKGVLLDLRNNPGGLLQTTVESASQFLKDGVVAYQVNRDGGRRSWDVISGGEALTTPLVILVNQFSASGSEVLAGAIQDRDRGVVVGTKTYGKGSVNHIRELSDGSALYVTIARWLTPSGNLIEGNGLTPDIEVTLTEEDLRTQRDPQFERALEALKAQLPR